MSECLYTCFKSMKIIQHVNENNEFVLWLALCKINIMGENERKD
jgi:hypothetical protein